MSQQQRAKSRTHPSLFSVHCPFSGLYSRLFAQITQVWLKIYYYFRSLSDTSVLEISAYLQRVILHLYIKSLARIVSVFRTITKWVYCHNSFETLFERKQWWWQAKFCFQLYELSSIHCSTAKNRYREQKVGSWPGRYFEAWDVSSWSRTELFKWSTPALGSEVSAFILPTGQMHSNGCATSSPALLL